MNCGARCPYEEHALQTAEAALAWQTAGQMLRGGPAGAEIDHGAALQVLTAEGVPAWAAATMLGAIGQGMAEGQSKQAPPPTERTPAA